MVFVDFKKAFDVVDHHLLLTKLRLYRLNDFALSWFQSYVTDRQQFVTIQGERSNSLPVKQGVPQGSVFVTGKRISKKLGQDIPHLNVNINNSEISEVSSHQLLGVTYDGNVTFVPHIDKLCKKLSRRLGSSKAYKPVPEVTTKGNIL
jgi:hypothetical protein